MDGLEGVKVAGAAAGLAVSGALGAGCGKCLVVHAPATFGAQTSACPHPGLKKATACWTQCLLDSMNHTANYLQAALVRMATAGCGALAPATSWARATMTRVSLRLSGAYWLHGRTCPCASGRNVAGREQVVGCAGAALPKLWIGDSELVGPCFMQMRWCPRSWQKPRSLPARK